MLLGQASGGAVRSGRARFIAVEQDVLQRAATVYLDLVRAEASLRYSTDYEDALRKSLDSTTAVRLGSGAKFLGRAEESTIGGHGATVQRKVCSLRHAATMLR